MSYDKIGALGIQSPAASASGSAKNAGSVAEKSITDIIGEKGFRGYIEEVRREEEEKKAREAALNDLGLTEDELRVLQQKSPELYAQTQLKLQEMIQQRLDGEEEQTSLTGQKPQNKGLLDKSVVFSLMMGTTG